MNLAEFHRLGREAWNDVDVPLEELATFLSGREAPPEHAAELYLTCACTRGDARALARFDETYGAQVRAAIARVASDPALADEALQVLRQRLFVSDGKPPGIAGYAGRGDLGGWLRVAATRAALGLLRTRRSSDGDSELDRIRAATADPELALMRREYGAEARAALAAAFAILTPRDRNLLRQYFVDSLNIDALGKLYGVHRATAARWVEKARVTLEKLTRAQLRARLGVSYDTLESIVRMLSSELHVSLSGLK